MKYNSTISDVSRAYVLLLDKEKKYSCRVIAKKANISKSSVSLILRENGKRKHYLKRDNKIGRPHKLTERRPKFYCKTIACRKWTSFGYHTEQFIEK